MEPEKEQARRERKVADDLSWTCWLDGLVDGLLVIDPEEDNARQRGEVAEGFLWTSEDDLLIDSGEMLLDDVFLDIVLDLEEDVSEADGETKLLFSLIASLYSIWEHWDWPSTLWLLTSNFDNSFFNNLNNPFICSFLLSRSGLFSSMFKLWTAFVSL